MLKDLIIENLILMNHCPLSLDEKLTVITGESGSGKTAILHGLKLLLGQKLDTSLIRKGAKKGFIQARFEIPTSKELNILMEEASIPAVDNSLVISREISVEGKSKNTLNQRLVSLSFLQKIGHFFVQIVDQHSTHELKHDPIQRQLLDQFGFLHSKVQHFSELFNEKKDLHKKEETLLEIERQKQREESFCLSQLEELEETTFSEEEEKELFSKYSMMSQAEELSYEIEQMTQILSFNPSSALEQIQTLLSKASKVSSDHKAFKQSIPLFESARISLQEALQILENALCEFESDPQKQEEISERLAKMDALKKKYGSSTDERQVFKQTVQMKLDLFDSLDEKKQALEAKKMELEQELSSLALELFELRSQAAQRLSEKVSHELQSLNMKGAIFQIIVKRQQRHSLGEDSIQFYLSANEGEKVSLMKNSSSGGELARVLLAVKLCLAEKNQTPTLIFDEIDAGVGGETARLMGEKLKALSNFRQIVCITHFPQVACSADLHLSVYKQTNESRTEAKVKALDSSLRESELLRMLGGKKTLSFYENS